MRYKSFKIGHIFHHIALAALSLSLVSIAACPQAPLAPDSGATSPDASQSTDASRPDAAAADTNREDAAHQIVAACSEINARDCFANMDCPEQQRCQNMGRADLSVPCCVDGQRGQDPVGHECSMQDGELTCASGLCIDGLAGTLCSGTCDDVNDCPDNMQLCQFIAYSNSDEQWCFPH